MNWSKIAVFAMIMIVIFSAGAFCSHFQYSVHGIPRNNEFASIQPINPGQADTKFLVRFKDGTSQIMTMDAIRETAKSTPSVLDYLSALASFSIDGMPDFFSYIFIVVCLLALYILVSIFLPGGSG